MVIWHKWAVVSLSHFFFLVPACFSLEKVRTYSEYTSLLNMSHDHGHMTLDEERLKKIEKCWKLAESHGFTAYYQRQVEQQENVVCHKERAPATEVTYARAVENWCLWVIQVDSNLTQLICVWRFWLSWGEPESKDFAKGEPDPSAQTLKLSVEDYIVTQRDTPSQYSVCHLISCFSSVWERKAGRRLPKNLKDDVYNVSHPLSNYLKMMTMTMCMRWWEYIVLLLHHCSLPQEQE